MLGLKWMSVACQNKRSLRLDRIKACAPAHKAAAHSQCFAVSTARDGERRMERHAPPYAARVIDRACDGPCERPLTLLTGSRSQLLRWKALMDECGVREAV